ncbi:hypothetical protein RIF29_22295 [Crotalaria pallida]|uniref:Uncharacterized protein n=1 Tax=Crotalaria pallida TaxID=3830 RepID=A0AAN9F8Y8_CROPI
MCRVVVTHGWHVVTQGKAKLLKRDVEEYDVYLTERGQQPRERETRGVCNWPTTLKVLSGIVEVPFLYYFFCTIPSPLKKKKKKTQSSSHSHHHHYHHHHHHHQLTTPFPSTESVSILRGALSRIHSPPISFYHPINQSSETQTETERSLFLCN